jgi:hypothetical protein
MKALNISSSAPVDVGSGSLLKGRHRRWLASWPQLPECRGHWQVN